MGADGVELCQYCGGELQRGTHLLSKPDSEGCIGYCRVSPEQRHRAGGNWITAGTITAGMITDNDFAKAMSYWEQQRRAMFRQIADAQAVRGQWHEGTCSGCGMDDLPVIGLPGSEYCKWCEELRTLVPVEHEPAVPAAPDRERQYRLVMGLACTLAAFLTMLASFFVGGDWLMQSSIVFFGFGFFYGLRA